MKRHYLLKCFSIVLYYGWFGLMYGMVFSLLLQESGFDALWLKPVVVIATFGVTVSFAYRMEMRYHMPTQKYIVLVFIALLGVFGCVKFPLLSPLFFALFLVSIAYKCRDFVAFTRIKP